MNKPYFKWRESKKPNVFECIPTSTTTNSEFYLQVERVGENVWWWSISRNGEALYNSYNENHWCSTMDEAKSVAQQFFIEKISKNKLVNA